MSNVAYERIGTPGVPWGASERQSWFERQTTHRSYHDDIVPVVEALGARFRVERYGQLDAMGREHRLFAFQSLEWHRDKPTVLVTGGVHGYETSGVLGALRFAETLDPRHATVFNFVIAPCVSPWSYETINRWNPRAVDPNRSFVVDSPAPEAALLMAFINGLDAEFIAHIDLHETTDTDNSEFRPARADRDAVEEPLWDIPDGFYLVGDSRRPTPAFQHAIIEAVRTVTHIAPADAEGRLIGEPIHQDGVIDYPVKELGLCTGITQAPFVTTTEVYPDSPKTTPETCILAQVAAVRGGLDFLVREQR